MIYPPARNKTHQLGASPDRHASIDASSSARLNMDERDSID